MYLFCIFMSFSNIHITLSLYLFEKLYYTFTNLNEGQGEREKNSIRFFRKIIMAENILYNIDITIVTILTLLTL